MALSRRSTVFIRELPLPSVEAIEEKLRQSDVPPVLSCEAAGPASWYLNFDSEETAQKAMAVLIQDGPKIFGQSIMVGLFSMSEGKKTLLEISLKFYSRQE